MDSSLNDNDKIVRRFAVADVDVVELDCVAHTGSNGLTFTVTARDDPTLRVTEKAVFIVPR